MATTADFSSSIGIKTSGAGSYDQGTFQLTAVVNDGTIAVGDAVDYPLSQSPEITQAFGSAFSATGDPIYYLGRGIFDGETGFVFGSDPDFLDNTGFFIAFEEAVPVSQLQAVIDAVTDFAANPESQTLSSDPVCFAAGTPIATPEGEVAVERLAPGDLVLTADGRVVPVTFVGRQTLHRRFAPAERFRPVRIRAGALGENVPHADLVVTADHALLVGGVLVNAGALVNGTSIVRIPMGELPDRVTYFHVETENHELILAAGAPAETFIDDAARRTFDNHAEYESIHGAGRPEMAAIDLPRAMSGRQVPEAVRALLAAPAAVVAAVDAEAA